MAGATPGSKIKDAKTFNICKQKSINAACLTTKKQLSSRLTGSRYCKNSDRHLPLHTSM
jgi:hypothetical protein